MSNVSGNRARAMVLVVVLLAGAGLAYARSTGDARPAAPDMIVIHAVSGPRCKNGAVVFNPVPNRADDAAFWRERLEREDVTGIHYVVGRSGTVASSIPEMQIANHASGVNTRSIGIELVNRGDGLDGFPPEQVAALETLVREIRSRHAIPLANIVAHADVDQRTCACGDALYHRRVDPNTAFSMENLRTAVASSGEVIGEQAYTPLTGPARADLCAG